MPVPALVFDQSEGIIWRICSGDKGEGDDISPDSSSVRSRELE